MRTFIHQSVITLFSGIGAIYVSDVNENNKNDNELYIYDMPEQMIMPESIFTEEEASYLEDI